eukprot:7700661-Alexandrium_andersonii.AAC.1
MGRKERGVAQGVNPPKSGLCAPSARLKLQPGRAWQIPPTQCIGRAAHASNASSNFAVLAAGWFRAVAGPVHTA